MNNSEQKQENTVVNVCCHLDCNNKATHRVYYTNASELDYNFFCDEHLVQYLANYGVVVNPL